MTKVHRNLDGDSNVLLDSMRQQEKQFEELSKELKLENSLNSLKLAHNKKLKRRSYSDYQTVTRKFNDHYNPELTKENSETESKRDFLHHESEARKRASSSLGIASCQQDENLNTNNNNFVGYTTSTQMYNQPFAPYGNHHYVPYHHYPQLFHHNYQQHVNRMMLMQQNVHNEVYYPINRYNHPPYYHNHNYYQPYQQFFPNNSPVAKKQHNVEYELPINQSKPINLPRINKTNYPKWKTSTPSNQEAVYSPLSNQDSVFLPPIANKNKAFSPSTNHVRSYSTRERKSLNRDDLHRHSYHFGNSTSDQLYISDESMTVKITEIIDMLQNSNYQESVSNAAAYIQHVTYGDDVMKSLLRRKGVVPVLVEIISNSTHHKVIVNSLGALKNMVYNNTEGKMSLANCGGLSVISKLLLSVNMQVKTLVTGILWNLTSCEQLKREVGCQTMNILIDDVILRYVTMLEPERTRHFKVTQQKEDDVTKDLENSDVTFHRSWLKIITNSTGCIRNLSCSGIHIRKQLRNYSGFIEALLLIIENVVGKQDIDCTAIENIVSTLRNLSYHIEEQQEPLGGSSDEESVKSCFKFQRKKSSKDAETLSLLLSTPEPRNHRLLVHPTVVRRYLALLSHSTNPQTLQSASGCLQNISAGSDSHHATLIRKTVRKLKGLPMLVELLHKSNNKVVEVVLEALTNLSFDERNKVLLGKHCMAEIIQVVSEVGRVNLLCQLLTSNEDNCTNFYSLGGVESILELKNNNLNTSRVVRGCNKLLQILWSCKSVKQQMKKKGWNKSKLFQNQQVQVNLSSPRQAQASPLVIASSNNSHVYDVTNHHPKMDSWV